MHLRGLDLHTVLPAHIVACAFTVFGKIHDGLRADFQPLHLFQHASGVFLRQTVDLVGNALKERLRHSPDAFIRDAVQFVPCDFYVPKLLRRSLFVGPHSPVGLAAAKPGHLQAFAAGGQTHGLAESRILGLHDPQLDLMLLASYKVYR